MPSFAAGLGELYFAQHYKRGAILRFNMECDDPERPMRYKFGVVLNNNPSEDEALLTISTSKLTSFASAFIEKDILRIEAGAYPCFDQPTVLSLREIRPESVAHLKTLCMSGQLTFHGEMSTDDLALIEQIVIQSRLIEGNYKKRILPRP
jgi:hypothetical protein